MATGYSMSALVDKIEVIESLPEPDFHLPLENNLIITKGKGSPVQVDVSAAQDGSVMAPVPGLFQADFSRASKKTCIQNGQLVEVGIDEPAFEDEGILIEGSSTNILDLSQCQGDGWYGTSGNINFEYLSGEGVLGESATLVKMAAITSNWSGIRKYVVATSVDSIYCASGFVKKADSSPNSIVRFNIYAGNSDAYINVDLDTGELVNKHSRVIDYSIKKIGNWWRLSITAQYMGDSRLEWQTRNYANDSELHVLVSGAQIEELPFATSYIPTEGTAVTRADDRLLVKSNVDQPVFSSNFSIELTFDNMKTGSSQLNSNIFHFYEGKDLFIDNYFSALLNWGNIINFGYSPGTRIETGISSSINEKNCSMFLRKNNKLEYYHDYKFITESVIDTEPLVNSKYIKLGLGSSGILYGHIKNFKIWNQALTPEQIALIGAKK